MRVIFSNLHHLPCIIVAVGVLGILATYGIAVSRGDVEAWIPYISDAGGDFPQSSLFSFTLILVAFMVSLLVYLLYLISQKLNVYARSSITWLSRIIVVNGVVCSSGLVMISVNPVGHLSKDGSWFRPVLLPHCYGALTTFFGGTILTVLLAVWTFLVNYPNWKNKTFLLRCLVVVIAISSLYFHITHRPHQLSEADKPVGGQPRHYLPETRASVISEWVIVLTFFAAFLTTVSEFRMFRLCLKLEGHDERRTSEVFSDLSNSISWNASK